MPIARMLIKAITGIRRKKLNFSPKTTPTNNANSTIAKIKVERWARTDEMGKSSRGKLSFLIKSLLAIREEVPLWRLKEKNIQGRSPENTKRG